MPETAVSVRTLAECEAVIERGLATFVEVGQALLEIRDNRLYRETHSTFEDYCRERWQLGESRAYQLMDAAEVAGLLQSSTMVELPPNERQARELVPLLRQDEAEVVEVWRELKETHGDRVTASLVRRAVDRRLRQEKVKAIQSSESNEWYTPGKYIEAARTVLGRIDLDPASHPLANDIVGAARFYAIEDDGLAQPWNGTVWLNPPYGSLASDFIQRAVADYEAEIIEAAILVTNSHATDAAWFQCLWDYPLCFTDHRIDFYSSETLEPTSGSTHGSVFAYLGPDIATFANVFASFGAVVRRVQ